MPGSPFGVGAMLSLKDKSVLVVGGSSGIGLAAAKLAAEAGAQVTIASRSQDKLDAAARALGRGVTARVLDAGDDASVDTFFADGKVWDHIVTSAGQGGRGKLADLTMDAAFAAMNAKFWSYFRVARTAKIAPGGSLTFVTGGLGSKPAPGAALVSAVNAAVEGMTRGLALDFAPVRVNTISPGMVVTPLWDQFTDARKQEMFDKAKTTLPARRVGEPEDLGHAILFVMTNPYTTGTVVHVDGGSMLL